MLTEERLYLEFIMNGIAIFMRRKFISFNPCHEIIDEDEIEFLETSGFTYQQYKDVFDLLNPIPIIKFKRNIRPNRSLLIKTYHYLLTLDEQHLYRQLFKNVTDITFQEYNEENLRKFIDDCHKFSVLKQDNVIIHSLIRCIAKENPNFINESDDKTDVLLKQTIDETYQDIKNYVGEELWIKYCNEDLTLEDLTSSNYLKHEKDKIKTNKNINLIVKNVKDVRDEFHENRNHFLYKKALSIEKCSTRDKAKILKFIHHIDEYKLPDKIIEVNDVLYNFFYKHFNNIDNIEHKLVKLFGKKTINELKMNENEENIYENPDDVLLYLLKSSDNKTHFNDHLRALIERYTVTNKYSLKNIVEIIKLMLKIHPIYFILKKY